MKDHVQVRLRFNPDGISVSDAIEELQNLSEGLVDASLLDDWGYGDYGNELYVIGWRPMTEAELAAERKKRARKAAATKARKKEEELERRRLYEELKKEFGGEREGPDCG